MEIGKFLGKLNTNYSVINYGDDVSSSNSFDQTALGLAVDTEFEPIKARFSYSISDKDNKGLPRVERAICVLWGTTRL